MAVAALTEAVAQVVEQGLLGKELTAALQLMLTAAAAAVQVAAVEHPAVVAAMAVLDFLLL